MRELTSNVNELTQTVDNLIQLNEKMAQTVILNNYQPNEKQHENKLNGSILDNSISSENDSECPELVQTILPCKRPARNEKPAKQDHYSTDVPLEDVSNNKNYESSDKDAGKYDSTQNRESRLPSSNGENGYVTTKFESVRPNKTLIIGDGALIQMKTLWSNCSIKSDENMKLSDIQGHLSHMCPKSVKSGTIVAGPNNLNTNTTVKTYLDQYRAILIQASRGETVIVNNVYPIITEDVNLIQLRKGINAGLRHMSNGMGCVFLDNDHYFIHKNGSVFSYHFTHESNHYQTLSVKGCLRISSNLGFRECITISPPLQYIHKPTNWSIHTEIGTKSQGWYSYNRHNPPPKRTM